MFSGAGSAADPLGFEENEATVRVGFLHREAASHQHEWRTVWGFGRHLGADNIVAALVEENGLLQVDAERAKYTRFPVLEEDLLASLRRFDVVVLSHLGGDL
ncbi:MAG: hypothetical protein VCB99_04505, partial [Myxococcota bacterium]